MAFKSLRTCTGFMPVKSPSSLLETASRPSSISCWVVLRYLVSLFVRPGCSVARTLSAPSFIRFVDGETHCNKMVRSCNKGALSRSQISKQGRLQRGGGVEFHGEPFIAARRVVASRAWKWITQGSSRGPSRGGSLDRPCPDRPFKGTLGASALSFSDRGELCLLKILSGEHCWLSQKERKSNRTRLCGLYLA